MEDFCLKGADGGQGGGDDTDVDFLTIGAEFNF